MSTIKVTPALVAELMDRVAELESRLMVLEENTSNKARSVKSENSMTEEHAFRVKFGDLKGLKHGKAAEALGLSYGQVFSCRGGYTFKQVNKDWVAPVVTEVTEVATAAE